MAFMEEKRKLNKEQLSAIKHGEGPLLIIAGAGTGKTTVITERIVHLIKEKQINPQNILALTFTEKASQEMVERVDVALPYGYAQMWISTFHSFCDRILRQEAFHIGLDPKYKLMTEAETLQFIRSHLFDFDLKYFRPMGNPTKFISGLMGHFSRLQDEDIRPKQYIDWVEARIKNKQSLDFQSQELRITEEERMENEKWEELASAYQKYEELKIKESKMDYGDLIAKTLWLFRDRPNLLKTYREQFQHVLVDEFQDTNIAQYELIKLIVPSNGSANITVVGDDSQSIYKFRGAAISNILHFKDDYPNAKMVVLTKNYRSSQSILDGSYKLIQNNNPDTLESKLGITKNLISLKKSYGDPVTFIHKDRVENEAEAVAKKILELTANSQHPKAFSDISILVRANNHAEPFIRSFLRHGIPYQFLGPGKLFRQPEIVDLISYLRVLYNFEDSVAFYKLLSIDYFDIPMRDIVKISNVSKKLHMSLFEVCEKIEDVEIDEETKEKIQKLMTVITDHLKKIKDQTAGQILYSFLSETGLLQELLSPDNPASEKRATNISKFFDKLKTYEIDHEDATVLQVVDWIDLSMELGESPLSTDTDWTNVNAVNILTVHGSKGLEFPIVFLVNLVGQRFPTNERREQIPIPETIIKEVLPVGDFHMQEERRLFYVGMTRAKEKLFFTAADFYGEGKREKKLSPFIFEALGDQVVSSEQSVVSEAQQLSFLDYSLSENRTTNSELPTTFHIDYLSYSQIECFRTCPLHYKLRYLIKIPTPESAALSFGSSMHRAMESFYQGIKNGESPTELFITKCLDERWIREGYQTKSHEKETKEAGHRYLKEYLEVGFSKHQIPVALEQSFTVNLPIREGERPLKIGGKIDRVDQLADGCIEIIDYKTGRVPDQKEVDKNMQLTFYAIAAAFMKEIPFGKKCEEITLSLYYFDGQKKFSTTRTMDQLLECIDEIYKVRKEIEESDFKCSSHMFCENCEFSLFCKMEGE
jgi:DNA helicase-2/ATP-dependent DNA helicase PcrA